jgi:hypothetical protein
MARLSNRPTRGTPLTAKEKAFKPSKGWAGGPRFHYTSTFGSASSNSGIRKKKKQGGSDDVKRKTIVPRWAAKYKEE